MNILQIVSNMKKNGPAMVVFDLAHGLAELGHTVYIAAGDGELVQEIKNQNIHFIHIPIERISLGNKAKQTYLYARNGIFAYIELRNLIEKNDIDIINSHQPIPNIYAKVLSKNLHINFVTTSHNIYSKGFLSNTYVSGDYVIACSDKVYENSIINFGVPKERITCIRNGVNPARLTPAEPITFIGKFVIGTIAGLRKQKALDNLIKAFSIFHSRVQASVLVIAGIGEEEENLKSLAKELRINDSVYFLGFKGNVADVLSGLDVFALSSEYEGLPISMLEAMVMKVPVVVTPVGGIPWVIKNEYNGLLCECKDVIQMANAFYRLYKDNSFSHSIAEAGYRSIIEEFSYKKMAEQYFSVYEKLIENG